MKRYSFQDVVLLINGVEISGWDEGDDVIQIKRREDAMSDKVGAGGEMVVSVSADRSGEITIKLMQTSPSNKFLSTLIEDQQAAGSRFTAVTILFQDTYRNDMGKAAAGYIKKHPDMMRGTKINTQEWVFVVERVDMLFGTV